MLRNAIMLVLAIVASAALSGVASAGEGTQHVAAGTTANNAHGLGINIQNTGTGQNNYLISAYEVDGAFDVVTITLPTNGGVTVTVTSSAQTDLKLKIIAPGGCTVVINNPGNVAYSSSTVLAAGTGGNTTTVSGPGTGAVANCGNSNNTTTFSGAPGWTQRP